MPTATAVSTVTLRISISEPDTSPTLAEFAEIFEGVQDLLFIGSFLDILEARPGGWKPSGLRQLHNMPAQLFVDAHRASASFQVVRASYQSPLEFLLHSGGVAGAVATAGTAAFFAAQGAIRLWGRWSEAREKHDKARIGSSKADLEIAINKSLTELAYMYPGVIDAREQLTDEEQRAVRAVFMRTRIERATKVLDSMQEMVLERD
ncbi:hypothetical protein HZU40_23710 [Mycolicibacterium fluoranthenivorans]|uniref:Uncharacterized protein n=1 Tax=Mycolicibacterium fluoranthenivorans TaxID=258505 RepID=A0A7G8PA37_9MYCO|nr:hypothetical protein [Mycolicibacterium fluoranthenivorans]QNJ91203.1 hypothetical protein HZU40_23710 [Mycolicibacterium fluoranthenivorans]